MDFYSKIAAYYDLIFPVDPSQRKFIISIIEKHPHLDTLLDIGCGTGSLAVSLSENFRTITGIDINPKMISVAKRKTVKKIPNVKFIKGDMLKIKNHVHSNKFGIISSSGNTISHLKDPKQIEKILLLTRKILKPGGIFIFQIINYDYLAKKKIETLPLIENEFLIFKRYYKTTGSIINFHSDLRLKKTNTAIKNRINLYPVTPNEIKKILIKTGYKDIELYGGYKKTDPVSESLSLTGKAR